ncbi:MAG: DMT family transporter [Granulosicoccus sp.]|nr:DMT family transporter [Granulosicoccus sp.]
MRGMAFMMLAIGLLSAMDAIAKWLTTNGLTVIQILALRSLVIVPLMLIVFSSRGSRATLVPRSPILHLYRGVIGFISPLTFFLGIRHIPLTDAVVVFFASTFIIALLSMLFLGERVGIYRWASIISGFLGVLVVVGPKGTGDWHGYALVFVGSATYALLFISGKYLSRTDSVASLVFSFNLCVGLISLILLPFYWSPMNLTHSMLLICLALLAVSGHYLITLAFSISEASLLAPFEYTAVLWALTFDLLIWQTTPALSTGLGATIIIASGLFMVHRERINLASRA